MKNKYLKLFVLSLTIIVIVAGGYMVKEAVESNHRSAARVNPAMMRPNQLILGDLPFCSIARAYEVSPTVLAGVYLAENQMNHDWTDEFQNALFSFLLLIRGESWWQDWKNRYLEFSNNEIKERAQKTQWSKRVVWSGMIFSLGPSQITTRTAVKTCENALIKPQWCTQGTKRLVKAMLDSRESLEVAALILSNERKMHIQETGVDVGSSPGKWATLYNFGGDLFRARFSHDPSRGPNDFGRWVDVNAIEIDQLLRCK